MLKSKNTVEIFSETTWFKIDKSYRGEMLKKNSDEDYHWEREWIEEMHKGFINELKIFLGEKFIERVDLKGRLARVYNEREQEISETRKNYDLLLNIVIKNNLEMIQKKRMNLLDDCLAM